MRVEFAGHALDVWPLAVIVMAGLLMILWRRKASYPYLLCVLIFSIYLLFALDQTFFPIWISGGYADSLRQLPFTSRINLIPFYFGPFGTLADSVETLVLNVALTIPFGFGVSFIWRIRRKTILWLALAIGLITEGGQLVISLLLGYPYREIDIDDVIMNALGVLIGYGSFRLFVWVYRWMMKRSGIRRGGLIGYIEEIVNRV
ncbi:MAG TPA: VanZ family protein [Phototrophicaceae bacterium]|nr:VanZ family protein [Phototrophicaceae bacterium]